MDSRAKRADDKVVSLRSIFDDDHVLALCASITKRCDCSSRILN
jgi:hypothetical protein